MGAAKAVAQRPLAPQNGRAMAAANCAEYGHMGDFGPQSWRRYWLLRSAQRRPLLALRSPCVLQPLLRLRASSLAPALPASCPAQVCPLAVAPLLLARLTGHRSRAVIKEITNALGEAPKRAPNAYALFSSDSYAAIAASQQQPGGGPVPLTTIAPMVAAKWRQAPEEVKNVRTLPHPLSSRRRPALVVSLHVRGAL